MLSSQEQTFWQEIQRYNVQQQTTNFQPHTHTLTLAQTNWIKSQQYFEPEFLVRYNRNCLQTDVSSYGTLSYGRRMRYEILVRCDFTILWRSDYLPIS